MAEHFRFTKFPLLTSKDLQQGEELDEQHYLMVGAADELTGIELKQTVLQFDADVDHAKSVATGSVGQLHAVKENWADFPAPAWQVPTRAELSADPQSICICSACSRSKQS